MTSRKNKRLKLFSVLQVELFRELQMLSTDYLRQRALYTLQDLVTRYLTEETVTEVNSAVEKVRTCLLCRLYLVYLFTCLLVYLLNLLTYLHTYLRTCLHIYILTYVLAYILTYLLTYLLMYLLTYLHTCLHTYFSNMKRGLARPQNTLLVKANPPLSVPSQ